jgi:lipoprotein-anchoring transpeptidase ErfK/SrfK
MRLLLFGILGLILLFGCAQKAAEKPADAMEKPSDAMEKPAMEKNTSAAENVSGSAMENKTETAPPPEAPAAPVEDERPVERFDVSAQNYEFSPSTITVKKGNRVRIEVRAMDRTYGFAIMDYGVNQLVPSGESVVVSFIAEKSGTFEIKNTHITSGAARNMVGSLVVTE